MPAPASCDAALYARSVRANICACALPPSRRVVFPVISMVKRSPEADSFVMSAAFPLTITATRSPLPRTRMLGQPPQRLVVDRIDAALQIVNADQDPRPVRAPGARVLSFLHLRHQRGDLTVKRRRSLAPARREIQCASQAQAFLRPAQKWPERYCFRPARRRSAETAPAQARRSTAARTAP